MNVNIVAKFEDLKTSRFFGLLFKEGPPWLGGRRARKFLKFDPSRLAIKHGFL